jgi:hypothetical protein
MGRLPRERHGTAHPLLHRGEVEGEFEEASGCLPQSAGGLAFGKSPVAAANTPLGFPKGDRAAVKVPVAAICGDLAFAGYPVAVGNSPVPFDKVPHAVANSPAAFPQGDGAFAKREGDF